MKKFLSLVLALVMTMSLVTVAGAKDFTDADSIAYEEAVDVMTALEIVGGYADGSFNPKGTLTRGAAAKIICNLMLGSETAAELVAAEAPYADVPADHVFAGYIAYCANAGIVSGYADGTFKPAATLTGYAFMKMLLGAVGYDAAVEGYTGTNWAINVAQDVVASKLTTGLSGKFVGTKALTREEACLYAFNALMADRAYYGVKADKITIGNIEFVTGGSEVSYGVPCYLYELNPYYDVLVEVESADEDALGRPARTWKLKDATSNIGTYAETADYVITGELDADEFADLFEELDVTTTLTAADTANGKTIELFYNADETAVAEAVVIEASLETLTIDAEDKVSTTYDDRALAVAGLYAVADAEKNTVETYDAAVELDNFDELYKAAEKAEDDGETLYVLLVKTYAEEEGDRAIYSVEIPEIVEAKVTRVKNDTITAGGKTYTLAGYAENYTAVEIGDDLLWVGANGLVYQADASEADVSDVIFLDKLFAAEEDKWGNLTYTAQIVNEKHEIVEITLAAPTVDDEETEADETLAEDAINVGLTEGEFYTYELNKDKEYELTFVEKYATTDMDKDLSYVKVSTAKKYFAADMKVVFIGGHADELEVTVKDGVQHEAQIAHAVLNSDGDVAVAYVLSAYEAGETGEILFFEDFTSDANVEDLEGNATVAYTAYLDGKEVEVMVANVGSGEGEYNTAGFYTFTVDAKTGEYTLKAKSNAYASLVVGGESADVEITKDKYVTYGETLDDATVKGTIYDLTKEGLTTLKSINKWAAEESVYVNFVYDTEAEVITIVYVTEIPA